MAPLETAHRWPRMAAPDGGWMMADGEAMARPATSSSVCECWQQTRTRSGLRGALRDAGQRSARTVGDVFRHLTAASQHHVLAHPRITGDGRASLPGDDDGSSRCREVRVARLQDADGSAEPAHGVVWMYIQRFSDEDLAARSRSTGKRRRWARSSGTRAARGLAREGCWRRRGFRSRRSCRWRRPTLGLGCGSSARPSFRRSTAVALPSREQAELYRWIETGGAIWTSAS